MPPLRINLTPDRIAFARSLVLYEDAHLIAFDKPAGLAVQGGSGVAQSLEHLLAAFAKSNGKTPRLVHRLDRETSGVIVAARTKPDAAFFSEAFAGRDVEKTYLAVTCGAPKPAEGVIDAALLKVSRHLDRRRPRRRETPNAGVRSTAGGDAGGPRNVDIMEVAANGQAARTRYRTLSAANSAALVELHPETGRMHQLRAHLAHIGAPIAGDGKYGGLYRLGGVEVSGLLLHALKLDLPHPEAGRITLEAPPPEAFLAAARSLDLETEA
jgi:tRNA pseudouridine32 synthase/23S rRNA pseudouridine746 synthase